MCAEEETATLAAAAHTGERLWIVDPIDGTRGFARKNGEFSVMIGFVDRGRIAVGVVLEPAKGRLTYAVSGRRLLAARRRTRRPTACRVSAVKDLSAATLAQSRSRDPAVPSAPVQALHPARVVETYSAGIKLALVARGEADVYLNTYDAFHDWDICAGTFSWWKRGGR